MKRGSGPGRKAMLMMHGWSAIRGAFVMKRKPSPRKLEPAEVVAKLKARTVAPKLSPKAARLLNANHCLVQS